MTSLHFPVSNQYGGPAVCFDFDGCLAQLTGSEAMGEPHAPMLALAQRLAARGWIVIVNSARPVSHNGLLRLWLTRYSPELAMLAEVVCGSKPAADVFVDDKGLMLPIDALEERIELTIRPPQDLWTQGNLKDRAFTAEWFEVHDNPAWAGQEIDTRYTCIVPLSGGLDSLTCLAMAARSGLNVRPVYVDTGAPYAAAELTLATEMAKRVGNAPLVVVELDVEYQTLAGYIDLGRNALLAWELAVLAGVNGWGEVWFGNVGDWQESPIRGGDKSARFFLTMQQVLTAAGHDVRIVNPLLGLTKVDLVKWWAQRGRIEVAAQSFSCYGSGPEHCGLCRACFKRWASFGAAGFAAELRWPHGTDFDEHITAFWHAARTDLSPSMAPGRWEPVGKWLTSMGCGPEVLESRP